MKGSLNYILSAIDSLLTIQMGIMSPKDHKNCTQSAISQFAIFTILISLKIITYFCIKNVFFYY